MFEGFNPVSDKKSRATAESFSSSSSMFLQALPVAAALCEGSEMLFNEQAQELFSLSCSVGSGPDFFSKILHFDSSLLSTTESLSHSSKKFFFERHSCKSKLGTELYLNISVSLSTMGSLLIFQDVTSEVIKELNLIKELELSQKNLVNSAKLRSLGEMSAGIAHEINNPLSIIIGRADHLIRGIEEGRFSSDKVIADLKRISATGDRITQIIRGLKTFSRNSDNDPFEPVELTQLVNDSIELCREKLRKYNMQVSVNSPHEVYVSGRPTQLSQVVLNLLSNSFDACHTLNQPWIAVEIKATSEMAQISVTDCGLGIDSSIVDRLMQAFFTTKEVGKGTGLGLSVSKGLVEIHGGTLMYDRQSHHTKFIIEIPLLAASVDSRVA